MLIQTHAVFFKNETNGEVETKHQQSINFSISDNLKAESVHEIDCNQEKRILDLKLVVLIKF